MIIAGYDNTQVCVFLGSLAFIFALPGGDKSFQFFLIDLIMIEYFHQDADVQFLYRSS